MANAAAAAIGGKNRRSGTGKGDNEDDTGDKDISIEFEPGRYKAQRERDTEERQGHREIGPDTETDAGDNARQGRRCNELLRSARRTSRAIHIEK